MRYAVYIIFLAVLSGLTVGLGPVLAVLGQAPNLVLLAVLVWSLEKDEPDFLFLAFLAGIFLDVCSGVTIGSFTLPFLALSLLVRLLAENFLVIDRGQKFLPLLLLPFLMFFYLFYFLANLGLRGFGLSLFNWDSHNFFISFAAAFVYNLLFIYPVFWVIGLVKLFLRKYVEKEYKAR